MHDRTTPAGDGGATPERLRPLVRRMLHAQDGLLVRLDGKEVFVDPLPDQDYLHDEAQALVVLVDDSTTGMVTLAWLLEHTEPLCSRVHCRACGTAFLLGERLVIARTGAALEAGFEEGEDVLGLYHEECWVQESKNIRRRRCVAPQADPG